MTSLHLRTTRLLRLAAVGTALAALSACGGPEGAAAPKDATVEDFCNVIGDLDVSDPSGLVDDMAETGTPEDIPDDARAGFEVMVDEATADDISAEDQEMERLHDLAIASPKAAEARALYGTAHRPLVKFASWLGALHETQAIFVSMLAGNPIIFFLYELIGLNAVLIWSIIRQRRCNARLKPELKALLGVS